MTAREGTGAAGPGAPARRLLSIIELGGYPNFMPLYSARGYRVTVVQSMRKALSALKKELPDVVVAEFNYQSDFRDRTSNLESLLATLQTRSPGTRVIVFYEREQSGHLDRLLGRFQVHALIPFPVEAAAVEEALDRVDAPQSAPTG
jgi:DNA-binding NtrC family response regulator